MQLKKAAPDKALRDAAETIALQALAYLAGSPERLGAFLAATGLGPDTVRRAAADPGFLPAVLEFLLSDEPMLRAFAAESGHDPAAIGIAHSVLVRRRGGAVPVT